MITKEKKRVIKVTKFGIKYIFSNFYHEGEVYGGVHINSAGPLEIVKQKGALSQNNWFAYHDNWNRANEQTNEAILVLIKSLNESMTTSVKEESW